MTRKDYNLIAAVMKKIQPQEGGEELREWRNIQEKMIDVMQEDNELFDADKFRKACTNVSDWPGDPRDLLHTSTPTSKRHRG